MLRYHDESGANLARLEECPSFDLEKAYREIHEALGDHSGDHPLAFIESGGIDLARGMVAYFSA